MFSQTDLFSGFTWLFSFIWRSNSAFLASLGFLASCFSAPLGFTTRRKSQLETLFGSSLFASQSFSASPGVWLLVVFSRAELLTPKVPGPRKTNGDLRPGPVSPVASSRTPSPKSSGRQDIKRIWHRLGRFPTGCVFSFFSHQDAFARAENIRPAMNLSLTRGTEKGRRLKPAQRLSRAGPKSLASLQVLLARKSYEPASSMSPRRLNQTATPREAKPPRRSPVDESPSEDRAGRRGEVARKLRPLENSGGSPISREGELSLIKKPGRKPTGPLLRGFPPNP